MDKKQIEKSSFPILPLHPSVTEKLFYKKKAWEKVFDLDDKDWTGKPPQPSLGSSIAHVLEFLSPMFNANLALDLGTSMGYSSYVLAKIVGPEGRVLTVERNEKLAKIARANFKKTGIDNRIALIMGEATEVIKDLKGPFDLILLDIDKNEYLDVIDSIMTLLAPGGHLITDDIGFISREFPQDLKVLSTHVARFIQVILKRPDLEHMYIPLGDGILVSRKIADGSENQLALFSAKKSMTKKENVKKQKVIEVKKEAIEEEKELLEKKEPVEEVSPEPKIERKTAKKRPMLDLSSSGIEPKKKSDALGPVESFDRDTFRKRNLAAEKKAKESGRAPRNLAQSLGKLPNK